jgi:hypothetical protein
MSHNTIVHADGLGGGAIDIVPTWFTGPPSQKWRLIDNLVISHNILRDIDGSAPRPACARRQRERVGIRIAGNGNVHGTVLYRNTCEKVSVPLRDSGVATARVCRGDSANFCECR